MRQSAFRTAGFRTVVLKAPFHDFIKNRHQIPAPLREGIFCMGRDFVEGLPGLDICAVS